MKKALITFVKAPVAGTVKTRLQANLPKAEVLFMAENRDLSQLAMLSDEEYERGLEEIGYSLPVDVSSTRAGFVPGTHSVGFDGPAEGLTLTHAVRDRATFAHGALEAARWVKGRKGWFSMRDVLGLGD